MNYENETIKRISVFLLNKLNLYIEDKISEEDLFIYFQLISATFRILNMPYPDRNTIEYLDFIKYIELINNLEKKLINKQELKENLYCYRLAAIYGDMHDCMQILPSDNDFDYVPYTPLKKTIYVDFNILQKIEEEFKNNEFLFDKDNFEFIYSPNHLEEVYRMNDDDFRDMRITTITMLTNNHLILPISNKLSFYTENPYYSYNRVIKNLEISTLAEEKRILDNQKRSIFFPQNINLSKTINNATDVFTQIPSQYITFKTNNFKDLEELRNCIYSMYQLFDIFEYCTDKKERTIKSSAYDIEHLIYASKCDYFVTNDNNCFKRSQQIFNKIQCNTTVLKYCDLCKLIKTDVQ